MNITWGELLEREKNEFLEHGSRGMFSDGWSEWAKWFGEYISTRVHGKVLDVGCGVIELPEYMKYCNVEWWGIDPLDLDIDRKFNYICGLAENMPFDDCEFDCVIFAASLNHMNDVKKAVSETHRVLKRHGLLIVWTGLVGMPRYKKWIDRGGAFDKKHKWAFTHRTIRQLFKKFKLKYSIHKEKNYIFVFRK